MVCVAKALLGVLGVLAVTHLADATFCTWIKYENTDSGSHQNWGDKCFDCDLDTCKTFCREHSQCTGFSTFHGNCYYRNSTTLAEDMASSLYNVNSDGVDLYVKGSCTELECGDTNSTTTCDLGKLEFPDSESRLRVVNCHGSTVLRSSSIVVGAEVELTCKDEFDTIGDEREKSEKADRSIVTCQDNGKLSNSWNLKHLMKHGHLRCRQTSANSLNCGEGSEPSCSLDQFTFPSEDSNMVLVDCDNNVLAQDDMLKTSQDIRLSCALGYSQSGNGNGTVTTCTKDGSIPAFDFQELTSNNAILCAAPGEAPAPSGNQTSGMFGGLAAANGKVETNGNSFWNWFRFYFLTAFGVAVVAIGLAVYKVQKRSHRHQYLESNYDF